jgi:acyl transferase domain-containing protein
MNKNEKQSAKMLKEIIQDIKDGKISVETIEIYHDVEKSMIPGTTILSPEYTGHHLLTVRWVDKGKQSNLLSIQTE